MNARAIFVGGTASHVGKSWIATALCRHLKRRGFRVAPFKAQNMSNNSYPCADGGEIGRAQVAQAEACGLAAETGMNPVLLKPTSGMGSQVILNGRLHGQVSTAGYGEMSSLLRREAFAAYDRLRERFDYIVIEGAGSVAEMNLKQRDFVNLAMAAHAGARGMLVADIDRGGVFASVCGTVDLLEPCERARIHAFVVNRFRGDAELFADGVAFLESRTAKPCLGVLPFAADIALDAEDGVSLDEMPDSMSRIAVIRLPHVSNFTDFRLLPCQWLMRPVARQFDWIVLPGTKNTIADLEWLRGQGFGRWIAQQHEAGAKLLGICGGFQMLGSEIEDPHGMESSAPRSAPGLGYLPVRTVLGREKVTRVVRARTPGGAVFGAYEIHLGETAGGGEPFATLCDGTQDGVRAGRVMGTYLHGALESPAVVREIFGIEVPASERCYDRLADWWERSANMRVFEEQFL